MQTGQAGIMASASRRLSDPLFQDIGQDSSDGMTSFFSGNDTAWLDTGRGERLEGAGPFHQVAVPPEDGIAFYVNDFALSEPAPWRIPAAARSVELSRQPGSQLIPAPPRVRWSMPDRGGFRQEFDLLMAGIHCGRLLKAVPAVTQHGRVEHGNLRRWIDATLRPDVPSRSGFAFGWTQEDAGRAGLTPEILCRIEGTRLTTMALAGTAAAGHAEELLAHPKLAREHAVVAEELQRRLSTLGRVTIGTREIVELGTMLHLRTVITVDLPAAPAGAQLNELISLLHPTPALGISPRTAEHLRALQASRERLDTPAAFGAPFGAVWPGGALIVVAIRGIFWEGNHVLLPAGCGLVNGSEFESEWAELELKRAWVRGALGLSLG